MDFTWYALKEPVADAIGLSRPLLHVLLGAVAYVVIAWTLRRVRHGLFYAWASVFALEVINEAADAYDWIRWTGHINTTDAFQDIFLTMLVPTIATLAMLGYRFRLRTGR